MTVYIDVKHDTRMRGSKVDVPPDFSDVDLDSQSPIPPTTEWTTKFRFLGFSINYVPAIRAYFLDHWEIHYFMPLTVFILIASSLAVYLVCARALLPEKFGSTHTAFLLVTSLLFTASYVKTILAGPGYLPFYFPYRNPNTQDGSADALSGMITTGEQEFYVSNLSLPRRTGYCRGVRRIVIRPDHYCVWTANFIGKKNYKLFFLFNLWGLLYILGFVGATLRTIVGIAGDDDVVVQFAVSLVYFVLAIAFAFLTGSFALSLAYEITVNQTTFEREKGGDDCVRNWEEVFGSRRRWWRWLLPVEAFPVEDDRLLLTGNNLVQHRSQL
jgi:hypothetical protein